MDKIAIYPFPYSSGSNLYIDLLYNPFKKGEIGDEVFGIVDCKNSFVQLLSNSKRSKDYGKNIIHIHWITAIYGSRFLIKSLAIFIVNFSIILFLKKFKKYRICWTMH